MHAIESKAQPAPPEPTMRQERTAQATIFEVFAGHEIGCELGKGSRSPRLDPVHFVLFGDCRKADDLPRLLGEHMAHEIVLVQPLHDDDNGAVTLVVEPAVEAVRSELLSGRPNSQGISSTLASVARICRQNGDDNQSFTSKFPTQRNRELIGPYQGIKSADQGSFLPDQGRALGWGFSKGNRKTGS
jgi:hypothetical protein